MIDRIDSYGSTVGVTGSNREVGNRTRFEEDNRRNPESIMDEVSSRLMAQVATGSSTITTVDEAWTAVEKIKTTILENRDAAISAQGTLLAEDILSQMGL